MSSTAVLYGPELFEAVTDELWDTGRVRDAIRAIGVDVDRRYGGPHRLWPADWASRSLGTESPGTNLYARVAGTLFGLDALRRRGLAETRLDLGELATRTIELFRTRPEYRSTTVQLPEPCDGALLTGETGILLLAWRLAPTDDLADALHARVLENIVNEAEDVMWGAPGMLLAAATMLAWTGRSAGAQPRGAACGACWRGATETAFGRSVSTERTSAGSVDGLANWPHDASSAPPVHLRWCAGAPGILASSAADLDEGLLLAGAKLVWHAGAAGGDGWYALWRGDSGVALYATDCVEARPAYPLFDSG
jgi:hypothetical protein